MITKKLKKLVLKEADNLKKFATVAERSNLNFDRLRPNNASHCIYGQMTGRCYTKRAEELLNQCTVPYKDVYDVKKRTKDKTFKDGVFRAFSPIEMYILEQGAKNENLINYLKGETDQLIL